MQQHNVGQPGRIEDLADRAGDGFEVLVPSRVHQCRRLVVDQNWLNVVPVAGDHTEILLPPTI